MYASDKTAVGIEFDEVYGKMQDFINKRRIEGYTTAEINAMLGLLSILTDHGKEIGVWS